MKAWGVERQPPRLPTGTTRAPGQCSSTAGLTRSSIITISACCSALTAFRVSSSGSPGPAPTSQTLPFMVLPPVCSLGGISGAYGHRPGGQQSFDFRYAGAAARAAFEFAFQAVEIEPADDP